MFSNLLRVTEEKNQTRVLLQMKKGMWPSLQGLKQIQRNKTASLISNAEKQN